MGLYGSVTLSSRVRKSLFIFSCTLLFFWIIFFIESISVSSK
jgi:hypothetical protein